MTRLRARSTWDHRGVSRTPPPQVTVLMPARDAVHTLRTAIASVLAQTGPTLELLVIDDGSQDETPSILAEEPDPRLHSLRLEQSLGVAGALNRGLLEARGSFIARLDADDHMAPDRIARQLVALEQHPDIDLIGSAMTVVDESGTVLGRTTPPLDPDAIAASLWVTNPIAHPSILCRRRTLDDGYPTIRGCEDWAAWLRLAASSRIANLAEPLTFYRVSPSSESRRALAPHELEECFAVAFAAHRLPVEYARPWSALLLGTPLPDEADSLEIAEAIVQRIGPRASFTFSRLLTPLLTRRQR